MTASEIHQAAAVGFQQAADVYERARPSYPADAVTHVVDALAIAPGRRVLDLAAGTGKFTRLLGPSGAEIIAVEPVAGMREQLVSILPDVDVRDGTAEALPVDDASIDAVVCAQAFHWFDQRAALSEIQRALRPGGGLAVVFNIRDENEPWVAELTRLTGVETAPRPHHSTSRAAFAGDVEAVGGYGPVTVRRFRYHQPLDEQLLVDRVASQSWIGAMPDDERGALLDEVRTLARTHPDLAGRSSFEMPYETEVSTCHRV
jgi:ubiquinone/menaquinone biosynthesis C-methylase UbiE